MNVGQGGCVKSPSLSIANVLHVPKLSLNLLSISQLANHHGCDIYSNNCHCLVQDRHSKKLVGTGHREGSLFILECLHLPSFALSVSGLANPPSLFYL